MHNASAPNPNIVVIASQTSTTTFRAEEGTDNRFFIFGTLGIGILRFEVVRRLTTGEHSTIAGREFFDAMLAYFGASVKAIEGNWSNANPERLSNLTRFNQATGNPKCRWKRLLLLQRERDSGLMILGTRMLLSSLSTHPSSIPKQGVILLKSSFISASNPAAKE